MHVTKTMKGKHDIILYFYENFAHGSIIFTKNVEIFLWYIMVTIDNACLNDVTPMAGLQQSVHVHAS